MSGSTIVVCVVALAFIGLVVASRSWQTTERIERVEVRGAHLLTTEEVCAQAEVAPRMRFGAIDLANVRRKLNSHPLIRRVSVERQRNMLVLDVTERTPVARLVIGGAMRLVDGEGVLFPAREVHGSLDLPLLCGVTSADGAGLDSTAMVGALAILRGAEARGAAMSGLISAVRHTADGTYWLETTGDAVPVRVGTAADAAAKFGLLQSFFPHLLRRGARRPEYVDLRFRDQVVVRWMDPVTAQ